MKKHLRRFLALFCALALCLSAVFAVSVQDALQLLETYYVDALPDAVYRAESLEELFDAVGDPYTCYMDAAAYARFLGGVEGESTLVGIGVSIRFTDDGILIVSLLDGGGAKDAGLLPGDLIIAVDGASCVPGSEQSASAISGEAGTFVSLTVRRGDGTEQTFQVERRVITVHNTTFSYADGVGFIDCNSFGSTTYSYFRESVERCGDEARCWLVDLRGNGGGYTTAAVNTVGLFGGSGVKLYLSGRDRSVSTQSSYERDRTDAPAIVLVDGATASSSEIFSGDVRAEKLGVVVGTRTYGKGLAQLIFDRDTNPGLFDGDAVKISAYRFYCADGNTTDKLGVLPTLCVAEAYTESVARLLCARVPASGEYLSLTLNGCSFTVDPAAALAAGQGAALSELLAALPPDVSMLRVSPQGAQPFTPAQALAEYGGASRAFTDTAGSPYADAIDTLGVYGILHSGDGDRFDPQGVLTRAELCAMLAQALNYTTRAPSAFSDVSEDSWYAGDVGAACALGLVSGVGGGRFDPDGTLTQEQLLTVVGRLAVFLSLRARNCAEALTPEALCAERYAAFAPWARESVGVLSSCAGGMLYAELSAIDPGAGVTREQAAAELCAVLKGLGILSY